MHLSKIRLIDIIALVIFLCFFWFLFRIVQGDYFALCENEVGRCVEALNQYAGKNDGNLPQNDKEFNSLYTSRRLELKLNYSFTPENVEVNNGRLFDKKTGKQVLVLTGPTFIFIRNSQNKLYEDASLKLYEEMLKFRH